MALRNDIQTSVASAFDTDLSDAVVLFTLRQYVRASGYDPTTGKTTSPASQDYSSRGVFDEQLQTEIVDSNVEPYLTKVIVLQNEISVQPRIGDDIFISGSADAYRIKGFSQDPAKATYELTARRVSP